MIFSLLSLDHACDFPFKYNGHYYHECINYNGQSSCAVTKNSNQEVSTWGQCNGYCPGEYTGGTTTTTTSAPTTNQNSPTSTIPMTTSDPGNCGIKFAER